MIALLEQLAHIDKNQAFNILNQAVEDGILTQIKIVNEQKIINTKLKKIGIRKHFYIVDKASILNTKPEITIKIILKNRLFFLKTEIKLVEENFYFDSYENLYELVRRKKPRFNIPENWSQTASIQSTVSSITQSTSIQYTENQKGLKSRASIIEMSKSGMKIKISNDLPRYEKNQTVILRFKVFRRAEIQVNAKIIYSKNNINSGPTIGVQFIADTILLKNKIQNVCDDLAFFYTAAAQA